MFTGGNKRGQDTKYGFLSPLDSPYLPLRCDSLRSRSEMRGKRGLGSVRRLAYGTLSGPEFTLRGLPRITVRGQTVQGGSVPLRKAPLPSSVDPWSTRRHCGPLAFRRATEGSRVRRRVWGVSRGGKGTIRCPCPLLSPLGDPGNLPRRGYGAPPPANRASGSSSAQISRVFFIFSGLQLTFPIFHGILNYRKQKKSQCLQASAL